MKWQENLSLEMVSNIKICGNEDMIYMLKSISYIYELIIW